MRIGDLVSVKINPHTSRHYGEPDWRIGIIVDIDVRDYTDVEDPFTIYHVLFEDQILRSTTGNVKPL